MVESGEPRSGEPSGSEPTPTGSAFVERRRRPRGPVRILVVVGTRRDAIKMLPVVLALREHPSLHPVVVCTGEERHLVEPILAIGGITPDVDLAVDPDVDPGAGVPGEDLNRFATSVIERFDQVVRDLYGDPTDGVADLQRVVSGGYPGAVLVHGDTSSAMAVGIAAFHLRLPVVHVEAGVRVHRGPVPFPSELNAQLISRLACFHLAPTPLNGGHLVGEGVPYDRVYVCGSTGVDAMRWAAGLEHTPGDPAVAAAMDAAHPLMVVTAHRVGQQGGDLERIASGVASLAERRPDVRIVVPMHPDAAIRHRIVPHLGDRPNVVLTGPMPYAEFAHLLGRADLVVTDSDSIQEEAPSVGTAVVVAAEGTEQTEGVDAGTLELVGTDPDLIVDRSERLLDDTPERRRMLLATNPYGDGRAASRIADALCYLSGDDRIAPERFGPGFSRRSIMRAAGYRSLRHAAGEVDAVVAATAAR